MTYKSIESKSNAQPILTGSLSASALHEAFPGGDCPTISDDACSSGAAGVACEGRRAPELLAPAGNVECLHAAVCAGADAVYLGLGEFNARRNAGNFTLESFAEACDYAHLRGVLIYVTLNVEVLPGELDRALELASDAYAAGADAFIVQDIGLAAALAKRLPEAPLHASTQMNIHNAAGIALAAQLGMSRVTLARELTLAEIADFAALAKQFGMEIECFAHGALCVCYSGQCLMSSMIGGRSANRGLCAQACRLPYELHRDDAPSALASPGEHLLSPKDLCTLGMLDDLAQAGVASLKIEGRMKSADYVYEVVSVYREVLDGAPPDEGRRARLAEAFSRGFTTAYLEGLRGNDIMSYGRPNNRGVFAGRVASARDGIARVIPEIGLNEGDIVEFWTNRGHFAATVTDARPDGVGAVCIPVEQRVGKGDRVFRVRNAATAFADGRNEPRVPVRGRVTLREGTPIKIAFEIVSERRFAAGEATGSIVQPARTRSVSVQDVYDHVNRLGATAFALESPAALEVEIDEGVGIGFSELHHVRADALDALAAELLAPYRGRKHVESPSSAHVERFNVELPAPEKQPLQVMAWVTNPSCARAVKKAGADGLYVPLLNFRRGQAQMEGVLQEAADQAGYPKQCVMALPTVDHDPVAPVELGDGQHGYAGTREYGSAFDMWDYVREGKPVFADSLADALRALEVGAHVEVGPHVPIMNKSALETVASWGVSRVWLSPELTLGQIAELAEASPVSLGLFAIGSQELMVCEHCLLMSQGPCAQNCETCPRRAVKHWLVDRKGFEFPVVTDMLGRSHLYNGVELDAAPIFCDLLDIGISAVMVDATLMDKKSSADAVGRAVRARDLAISEHRGVPKRPGATTGHLFRGVS